MLCLFAGEHAVLVYRPHSHGPQTIGFSQIAFPYRCCLLVSIVPGNPKPHKIHTLVRCRRSSLGGLLGSSSNAADRAIIRSCVDRVPVLVLALRYRCVNETDIARRVLGKSSQGGGTYGRRTGPASTNIEDQSVSGSVGKAAVATRVHRVQKKYESRELPWCNHRRPDHPPKSMPFLVRIDIDASRRVGVLAVKRLAVFSVAQKELANQLATAEKQYPRRSRILFLRRLLKYGLRNFISYKVIFALFVGIMKLFRKDYNKLLEKSTRGFSGHDFFKLICRRSSSPLVVLLARRIRRFKASSLACQRELGNYLCEQFQKNRVSHCWNQSTFESLLGLSDSCK